MRSFPIDHSTKFPFGRLSDFNPSPRLAVFVVSKRRSSNRQNILWTHAFLKLGRGRKVHSLGVGFAPSVLAKIAMTAVLFSVLGAVFFEAFAVRNTEAMLGAKLSSFGVRRLESKDGSAFLTRFFHTSILSQNAGLMTVPFNYFLDGAAYCKAAEMKALSPTLFDLAEIENEEVAEEVFA